MCLHFGFPLSNMDTKTICCILNTNGKRFARLRRTTVGTTFFPSLGQESDFPVVFWLITDLWFVKTVTKIYKDHKEALHETYTLCMLANLLWCWLQYHDSCHRIVLRLSNFCSVAFGTQVHWRSPLPSYSSQCLCLCWEPADWKLIPEEGMSISNIYTITFFESSHANFPIQCRHCGHVSQLPWGVVFRFWSCCIADGVEA